MEDIRRGGLTAPAGFPTSQRQFGMHTILVGSYKEIKNNSGGGMWIAGGGMIGAGISMAFIPAGGFTRDSWTKSARFKMLLDAKTFEYFDGEIAPPINDRIKEYTRLIRIPGGVKTCL